MREREDIRIEIVDTIGEVSLDCLDRLEHIDELRFSIEISTVASRILREYLDLTNSLR
jgi:hypothetical protein